MISKTYQHKYGRALAGIQVRAVLSPGNTLGAAILTANVAYKPGNTFFDINNRGSASVGPERSQVAWFLNSPLGQGERITISGATTPTNTSELADTSAVLSVPIGFEGWRFSLNGAYTNVRPGSDLRKYNTAACSRVRYGGIVASVTLCPPDLAVYYTRLQRAILMVIPIRQH